MLKNLMTNLVNVLPADLAAKVLADIMKATESMDPTLKERMIQNMLNDLEALPEGLRDAALKEIMKNMDNLSSEQRQKLLENILNKVLCCLAFGLFVCSSPFPVHNLRRIDYRKFATYRPGGMQFLATHNFWTTHFRTMIWLYSERMQIFLSEYIYMIILRCVVQKLCVDKNCMPPGLSIANLRYNKIL